MRQHNIWCVCVRACVRARNRGPPSLFMKSKTLFLLSKGSATCPYPKPDKSNTRRTTQFL